MAGPHLLLEMPGSCLTNQELVFPKRLFNFVRGQSHHFHSSCSLWSWLPDVLSHQIGGWYGESVGLVVIILGVSELRGVSPVSITSRLTSHSDNSRMDGARDAVFVLDEDFWNIKLRFIVSAVVLKILFG